jgi:hypothetical protein
MDPSLRQIMFHIFWMKNWVPNLITSFYLHIAVSFLKQKKKKWTECLLSPLDASQMTYKFHSILLLFFSNGTWIQSDSYFISLGNWSIESSLKENHQKTLFLAHYPAFFLPTTHTAFFLILTRIPPLASIAYHGPSTHQNVYAWTGQIENLYWYYKSVQHTSIAVGPLRIFWLNLMCVEQRRKLL